ncbi:hypothetical protein PMAG_a2575 [Pseudoalteromonas mariniglutinosa NCIMB 1770]|nr:hypothetical protein [Pseudoalteromonas mariniglutinosa NCIMB 1770]
MKFFINMFATLQKAWYNLFRVNNKNNKNYITTKIKIFP